MAIKVLLVDESPLSRSGLRNILCSMGIVQRVHVSEAQTLKASFSLAASIAPDFIFIDPKVGYGDSVSLRESKLSHMAACRELKSLPSMPRVIGYTEYSCLTDVVTLMLAGIDVHLDKRTGLEPLKEALERIFAYKSVWMPTLKAEQYQKAVSNALRASCLSVQEEKVFILLLTRLSNKEIADTLQVAPYTVKNHVSNLLRKLGYKNRTEIYEDWHI